MAGYELAISVKKNKSLRALTLALIFSGPTMFKSLHEEPK